MEDHPLKDVLGSNSAADGASVAETARRNHVPPSSLYHRTHGRPTRRRGHASQQRMSVEEEEALADTLVRLVTQGSSPSLALLSHMAHSMLKAREGAQEEPMGKHWASRFIKRHSDKLSAAWSSPLPSKRAEAGDPEMIKEFLATLQKVREEYGVGPEDLWNMDEKGYILGSFGRERVLVRPGRTRADHQLRTSGN